MASISISALNRSMELKYHLSPFSLSPPQSGGRICSQSLFKVNKVPPMQALSTPLPACLLICFRNSSTRIHVLLFKCCSSMQLTCPHPLHASPPFSQQPIKCPAMVILEHWSPVEHSMKEQVRVSLSCFVLGSSEGKKTTDTISA